MKRRHQPSLNELAAFESAARHGNFTRAAQELNLAQSAISRQVRNLEEKLGVELFERIRQRVALTTAGRLYLPEVKAILTRLTESSERIMSLAGYSEVINLAVLPTFATRWLLPRLPEFIERHPKITVNFEARLTMFDFAGTVFDAAIHYGHASWPGAHLHHLFDEEMIPVCSPSYRKALALKTPEDLLRAKLLHQSTRPSAWQDWFAAQASAAAAPSRGAWFEQFAMVAQAAVSGLGAALLPRILIEEEIRSGKLVVLFDRFLHTTAAYYLAVPEGKGPSIEVFTSWLHDVARRHVHHKSA